MVGPTLGETSRRGVAVSRYIDWPWRASTGLRRAEYSSSFAVVTADSIARRARRFFSRAMVAPRRGRAAARPQCINPPARIGGWFDTTKPAPFCVPTAGPRFPTPLRLKLGSRTPQRGSVEASALVGDSSAVAERGRGWPRGRFCPQLKNIGPHVRVVTDAGGGSLTEYTRENGRTVRRARQERTAGIAVARPVRTETTHPNGSRVDRDDGFDEKTNVARRSCLG
jgi:hypothetical protein